MRRRLGFDLIILGAPAAGKDTQAALLRKAFRLKPVESGKHWRRMASRQDAVGERLRRTFSKGQPTPVDLMKEFLTDQLKQAPRNADFVFIGNPRLKPEAQLLVKMLKARDRDFLALHITLPDREITRRSNGRRRDEQDVRYVQNRIRTYRTQMEKTFRYFESLGKLRTVDGSKTIKRVAADIIRQLNDYQRQQANRIP